jgi:sodium-dependent phosphate transporter
MVSNLRSCDYTAKSLLKIIFICRFFFSGAYDEELGKARPEDAEMHAAAFQRGSMVEDMFQFMQLSTCCFFSLSHGANDVANAVGPFSAVWMVYSTGKAVESKAPTPTWILVYGGLALDIGILTMGHQIMKALGNRLTLQSPSRGFCIELGAMFTVMIASKLGIPVSTTHCITGSTFAVGLCNGNLNAVNWKLFAVIYAGWILTCPAAGVVTGLVYWAVASAPHPLTGNGFFVNHVPV